MALCSQLETWAGVVGDCPAWHDVRNKYALVARWAAQGIPAACGRHFAGHGRAFQGMHGNKTIYATDEKLFPACGAVSS